jgi:hypothetical protein
LISDMSCETFGLLVVDFGPIMVSGAVKGRFTELLLPRSLRVLASGIVSGNYFMSPGLDPHQSALSKSHLAVTG